MSYYPVVLAEEARQFIQEEFLNMYFTFIQLLY